MITSFEELSSIRREHTSKRIVFAGGVFDCFHVGHLRALEAAKEEGEVLAVGVSSDERVRQRKGLDRPIIHEAGRLAVVNAIGIVDYAFLMPLPTDITPTVQVIKALQPDVFSVFEEETPSRWQKSEDEFAQLGTAIIYNRGPKLDSTTAIIARILASDRRCPQSSLPWSFPAP